MNPATGSGERNAATESSVVWRTLLVKGGNMINVQVKVVHEHVIYIVCEPRYGLKNGKRTFSILKGALLIRNTERDTDANKYYMVFNGGIYDALRSQGKHVPASITAENAIIVALQSSVHWGVRQTWALNKRSPPEEIAAYAGRIGGVATRLRRVRDGDKVAAGEKAAKATKLTDRRGRMNPSSRSPILWSANHRLDARVRTTRRIRPKIEVRNWDLVALADMAWVMKREFEDEVLQALRWWQDGRTVTTARARSLAARFADVARRMRTLSLAPYSRRGFPRIADDLDDVVVALREGAYAEAEAVLHKCRRAFLMMDARRKIEEMDTTASCVRKQKVAVGEADLANLEADLAAAEAMLYEGGKALDHDFKNPVIEPKVIPKLKEARTAARHPDGYQPKAVHKAIDAARLPL